MVPKSFGASVALQLCLVTWQLANPWLHGLIDPYPVLYISIFKLPREYIYRGSKNNNNNTKTVRGGERGCDHGQHTVGVRDIVILLPVGIVRAADSVEVTHITMSHTSARSLARYGMCVTAVHRVLRGVAVTYASTAVHGRFVASVVLCVETIRMFLVRSGWTLSRILF